MTELSVSLLETLRKGSEFSLYRGRHSGAVSPVLLLATVAEQPAPESLRRLEHEYSLATELNSSWAARPLALGRENGRVLLVLEDFGGNPLDQILAESEEGSLDLPRALRIAIGLTAAVDQVHRLGLLHKDIKPANALVDAAGRVRLTGFGIASRLTREHSAPEPVELLAGTLAYMAPEQTGRMNRSIDARSDLYSLGVTLYELFTGVLPFQAEDPLEWVHCHIARRPVSPSECAMVPEPLAAIVMKLLNKTAEERYQTAAGLEADLRRCLTEWESHGRIAPFPLGEQDALDRLLIPEKLYGRDQAIESLLHAFDQVIADGVPELVLVSGYSGIGKSSVVQELHKALVPSRGLFAAGKFDQYKRDIPYATLAQAFQNLVRLILAKSEAEVRAWKCALLEAINPAGLLIVNLIPELELILGRQPPVQDLPPQDAQTRFQRVFRRFLGVFARPEHPLVLFLDDLQWMDAATLDLLEDLMTEPEVRSLLLVGSYRDQEVDHAHPLMRTLAAIRAHGAKVREIVLSPLTLEDVSHLTADLLRCERDRVEPLAQLVHAKTAGNPFFAIQFLTSLADERLLVFDTRTAAWTWDLERIRAKGYTDNVVDLMTEKLSRLPAATQDVLKPFACLGIVAEIGTLALVCRRSEEQIHRALADAVRAGLVFRLENSYRFLHDRVKEAAYILIPQDEQAEMHLNIGRLLAANIPYEKRQEMIFEIVNQFNRSGALITTRVERDQVAELNFIAGKRARSSTAYASALRYFVASAALLADDCWERQHQQVFAIELHRAECEFLLGELAHASARLALLATRAVTTVERAIVASLRIDVCTTLDQSDEAVAVCLEYLRHLGVAWSPHPTPDEARREYERIWSQLGDRPIEALLELPLMTDAASLATLDVLTKVLPAAWFTDVNFVCLAICRAVNLSLSYGNSDGSCFTYVWLGMIAGPQFGNYKAGFRFGRLGYELVEKRNLKRFQARTYMCFGSHVMPWTQPIVACRDLIRRAFEIANQVGDLTFAAYSCNNLNTNLLAAGDPLPAVQREAENGLRFARKARFGLVADIIISQLGLIRTLRGLTSSFGSFDDEQFEETRFETHLAGDRPLALAECWYWTRKLQARFFAGDYAAAIDASGRAQRLLWVASSLLETVEYHFYSALAEAAYCNLVPSDQRGELLDGMASHHRELVIWAENCPQNFEDREALVAAEIARVEGRELDAERFYEHAIGTARENGFVPIEAIANELAGNFYASRGFETIAHTYRRNARYAYLRWGADGKVQQLDQRYARLEEDQAFASPTATIGTPVGQLDVATVTKASQALSSEIVLSRLIETLMRIAVEHAGAERGVLILLRDDKPGIEAIASTGQGRVKVELAPESAIASELLVSALHYVIRTRESVLLDDASAGNIFSEDEYVQQKRPKSILCLPILQQAKLVGALYLENNLTPRAFTAGRLAVLEILASQAAISLEHARIYADLQQENMDRKRAEEELRRSEAFLAEGQRISHTGSWGWNLTTGKIFWSDENFRILDFDPESTKPSFQTFWERVPVEDRPFLKQSLDHATRDGRAFTLEYQIVHRNGSIRTLQTVGRPIVKESGEIDEYIGTTMDITDRKHAEMALRLAQDELRQSQKMEAIGRLAGGVAHDFNNLLGVIIGYSELLQSTLRKGSPQMEHVEQIAKAAEQAASLTRNLLTFSRRQMPQNKVLDLQLLLSGLEKMLRSVVGEDIELILETDSVPNLVRSDPGQIEQAILNLVINARDAMPSGGRLTLALANVVLNEEFARVHPKIKSGAYVRLTVSDTGCGMDAATQARIFEPFFTTKDLGKGTGLGLATVYGTIEQTGGMITVESEPEKGTSFHLYIPQTEEALAPPVPIPIGSSLMGGSETILLVEDQDEIRSLLSQVLAREGYTVLPARNGREALLLAQNHTAPIDLMITDIVMPQMSGHELAREMNVMRPAMKVLYMSGYADQPRDQMKCSGSEFAYLEKPFSPDAMMREVRAILDTPNLLGRSA